MVKLEKSAMITLIAVALFIVLSLVPTYGLTRKALGSVVGQPGTDYASGETFRNRGFLIHAVVFGAILFFILRRQLKAGL